MGILQAALKGRQAFVELFEIAFKLELTIIGDCQHQHGQVVQHRHQLIHIQPGLDSLDQRIGLSLMPLRQGQFGQQAQQARLNMLGNRAVSRLGLCGQGVLRVG